MIVGEIGILKKEITFSGDVLNTTARIQGLCNEYGVDLLISEDLYSKLNLSNNYEMRRIGACELRGKDEKVELMTITDSDDTTGLTALSGQTGKFLK